ncbi:MAG: tryptophan synthase subunit alpha [Candidatus Omnitrophota bacterium]
MNRIDKKFEELRAAKKKAFIAFITAGYPDLETTGKLILEFSRIGVDIVELGIPFSDPLADGRIIQEASKAALDNKINLNDIFALVERIRPLTDIPIVLMTYYNPIFCFGEQRFAEKAGFAGVDGVIVPDLPPEEARCFIKYAKENRLDTIFFLAPTTTRERIKFISQVSSGFIYYVSLTGVTGMRQKLPKDLKSNLEAVKQITAKPVCVGFGVSTPEQVKELGKICDGVIVGSAIVEKIKNNIGEQDLVEKVGKFVYSLNRKG